MPYNISFWKGENMLENINLRNARITFNDLIYLNTDIPLIEQLDNLKEDLLQIEVNQDFIVDVGFYPEFSSEGEFKVQLIKDYDWGSPILIGQCKEVPILAQLIQEAIDRAI